jgi:methionyl-tRNA formyltransferase
MRIIFLGSSTFAVPSLKALVDNGQEVVCVVTQPDRRKGRGLQLGSTAVKELAVRSGLPVFQPEDINRPEAVEVLRSYSAQLLVIVSYGQILSSEILGLAELMAVNIHGSLLPAYRGAAPINWAIINGETVTGNTLMKVTRRMDAGPIVAQSRMVILAQDDAVSLEEKLAQDGARLLLQGLGLIGSGAFVLSEQDESRASFAPKLTKELGDIDWSLPALRISDLIRGIIDWPTAYTFYKGKRIKILQASVVSSAGQDTAKQPGEIIELLSEGMLVSCGKDNLLIRRLQPEAGRPMKVSEFIAGHRVFKGERLEAGSKK